MQLKQTIILLTFFLFYSTVFSQKSENNKLFERAGYDFPYQLSKPDKSWKLPRNLVEISGLSDIDKHRLACVQDEKGNVYIFNLKDGEIETKINFGKDGDYEGIEIIENDVWIIKSNGTLYEVKDYLKGAKPNVKKYTTALSGKNDVEGLAYDPVNKNLLIACKGHPFIDEKGGKEYKAIYGFNLKTKQLDLNPFLLIKMDTIRHYKNYNTVARLGVELLSFLDPSKGDVSFQPSGIAIHPITGNIYILGSVGKLLIVFSGEGEMLALIKLNSKIYPQPEGICFKPDGTLYISNEGGDKKGTILKFLSKN